MGGWPKAEYASEVIPKYTLEFTMSEVMHLRQVLTGWEIKLSNIFGPYELLNFTLGSYADGMLNLLCTIGCYSQFYLFYTIYFPKAGNGILT
jgi:hypothetical protein